MATIVRMPEVVTGLEEATLTNWLVQPGQHVTVGTPIAEIETDKAMVEYAAEVDGVLAGHLARQGEVVAVGDPIAVLADAGESVESALAETRRHIPNAGAEGADTQREPDRAPAESVPDRPAAAARQFASPLVRKLARERGLDLSVIRGTGPNGRIVKNDILRLNSEPAADSRPAPATGDAATRSTGDTPEVPVGFVDIPLTPMRRAIASRLTHSKSTVPHFYLEADCRVDRLLELRRTVNEHSGVKVSVNDFIVKAVAAAFQDVPEANAIWMGDSIRRFDDVDIAVAVAVESGLVTPVARNVARKTVTHVSREIADLIHRARANQLKQAELEGGSFCVSNLGMYGTDRLTAIINPPQSGILAVGAASQRPVVIDGELAIATVMSVTLSGDHRVYDGALGAQWLAAFVKHIENPFSIIV